jgi:hypothetical protein
MNDHDEMEFENDRGPGPNDMPYKTKTQEEPGNKGGYQGTNRGEREQGPCGLEQQQGKSKNDDDDDDEDVNWKVVRGRKSGTPLREAYTKGSDDTTENAKDQAAGTYENNNKQNNNTHKFGAQPGAAGGGQRAIDERRRTCVRRRTNDER